MDFEGILNQIFQPYFYYSVMFLVVSFVCVKILTKYCNFIGQRTKSLVCRSCVLHSGGRMISGMVLLAVRM